MSSKWHGGKGDKPRKTNNQKQYADNWDRIFGKKDDADLGLEGDTRDPMEINSPENKTMPDHDAVYYPQDKDLSTRD